MPAFDTVAADAPLSPSLVNRLLWAWFDANRNRSFSVRVFGVIPVSISFAKLEWFVEQMVGPRV